MARRPAILVMAHRPAILTMGHRSCRNLIFLHRRQLSQSGSMHGDEETSGPGTTPHEATVEKDTAYKATVDKDTVREATVGKDSEPKRPVRPSSSVDETDGSAWEDARDGRASWRQSRPLPGAEGRALQASKDVGCSRFLPVTAGDGRAL
ncbi:hypothetical protein HOY80DRAFT_1032382 [Tuber brumale]|nr:hypothetical protein HOY80DRAFT_1032382 [Tuber brumale]